MIILLGEVNFWTFDDAVNIKDTDFGSFRYHDKRTDSSYAESKRSYARGRGMICVPQNKKGNKLKDSIKYLEEQLKDHSVVYCQWCDERTVQLVISSGLVIRIQTNRSTGDIQKIIFDKYLVGKVSDHISDVIITKTHLICTYNDNQITLVHFTKPKRSAFEKMSRLDPKLLLYNLTGQNGRRLDRKIRFNKTGDLILIWWKSTMNEVFPWSPSVKEHDRANVHLYHLIGLKVELLCFLRTEFDPLCVTFSRHHENVIHSVEQKVSRKGEVTIEWRTYEVSQLGKLQRLAVTSVPLPTHTSCIKFSPNYDMLLLCCIDGSVTLHDQVRGTNNSVKASFIPTLASWHCDGIVFTVSNERGQFQHFDVSMCCIRSQILSEETTPANILDLSTYFRNQPTLLRMEWSNGIDFDLYSQCYGCSDSLFLLLFERGPLGVIKFIEGGSLAGDELVRRHLNLCQVERATTLLLSMNWNTHPQACMNSLNQIINYLFKLPLTPETEGLIQSALGSFHVPIRPISQTVENEYGDEVRDLTRRFFHHLLRHRLFETAFRLAIDLNDHDLFMDIHYYALTTNDMEMAVAAKHKAEHILVRSNSCSSTHSTCSRPSCSLCSTSESNEESESYGDESGESEDSPRREKVSFNLPPKRNHMKTVSSHVPPLPILHSRSNILSTTFNDIDNHLLSSINEDNNLMSTAFNVSHSNPPPKFFCNPSSNFARNSPSVSTNFSNPNLLTTPDNSIIKQSRSFNDVIGDLMSTSFSNLTVRNSNSPISDYPANNVNDRLFVGKSNNVTSSLSNNISNNDKISTLLQNANSLPISLFNDATYDLMTKLSVKSPLCNPKDRDLSISVNHSDSIDESFHECYNDFKSIGKPETLFSDPLNASKLLTTSFNNTDSNVTPMLFYNHPSNLMSTSFNNFDDNAMSDASNNSITDLTSAPYKNSVKNLSLPNQSSTNSANEYVSDDLPPPPSIKNSYNYVHSLSNKNYRQSQSTPVLVDSKEYIPRYQIRPANAISKVLQRQNSVTSILQNHHKNTDLKSTRTRTYRVNYDLDFIPFHGSCDNLSPQHSGTNHTMTDAKSSSGHLLTNPSCQLKLAEKIVKENLVPSSTNKDQKFFSNIPPLPIINTSFSNPKNTNQTIPTPIESSTTEKPKVKFSDTVTHILVPGTGQAYRPVQKRSLTQLHPMDPKRELAESLPLCLGNEDYLKDFQPLSKDCDTETTKFGIQKQPDETAKIKIVHFGLL